MSVIITRTEAFLQTTLRNLQTQELLLDIKAVLNYVIYLKGKLEHNSIPRTKVEMLIESFCTEMSEKLNADTHDEKHMAMRDLIHKLNAMRESIKIKNDNLDEIIHHDVDMYLQLLTGELHGKKSYLDWAKTQRSSFFTAKKTKTQVMFESLIKNLKALKHTDLQMAIDDFHMYTQEHLKASQKAEAEEIYRELHNTTDPINFKESPLSYLQMCNLSLSYLKFKLMSAGTLGSFIIDLTNIIRQEEEFTLKSKVHEKLMTSKIAQQKCSARLHKVEQHVKAAFISNPTAHDSHHIPVMATVTAHQ